MSIEKIEQALRISLESATGGEWWFWNEAGQGASSGEPIAWLQGLRRLVKDHSTGFAIEDAAYIVAAQPENIRALLDELSRLREALKPFAAAAEKFDAAAAHFGAPLQPDTYVPHTAFTYGELRAAARVLSERKGQE